MLIGFISDIHGNLPALESALADLESRGATKIVGAGDYVGYGPSPNEVCDLLQQHNIQCISGNYDHKVLAAIETNGSAVSKLQKKKREIVLETARDLGKSARRFLMGLPSSLEFDLPNGKKAMVVHGSPMSDDDDILPSVTAPGLAKLLGDARPDVLVCGHTHIPFVKRVGGTLVVNCGSTGQPVDGDPRPSYAIVAADEKSVSPRIVRFAYDVERTVAELKKSSMPKGLQKDLMQGTKRRFLD